MKKHETAYFVGLGPDRRANWDGNGNKLMREVEESEAEAEEDAEDQEKDDETSVPGASAKRKTVVALENDPQQRKVNVTVHDRKKFNLVLLMKFCN